MWKYKKVVVDDAKKSVGNDVNDLNILIRNYCAAKRLIALRSRYATCAKWICLLTVIAITPLLSACGSGSSGSSTPLVVPALCPSSLDYTTAFTGGTGSGELVKLQIDTTKLIWQVTYVESPVPQTTGTVTPTRAGTTQSGTLSRETALPTPQQNSCAYRLNGASLDPTRPARVFVGEGVVGGTIPGATIQYNGTLGVGAVPSTTFPYYPFIGFSSLETDLSNVAGTYNELGYHQIPSQNFVPVPVQSKLTINADGTWVECDSSGVNAQLCQQAGANFVTSVDGSGAFEINHFLGQAKPTQAASPQANGFLIVGKMGNRLVPILLRTGVVNPGSGPGPNGVPGLTADDESGISLLSSQTTIAEGSENGEYIGVDSQFDYRTVALVNAQATMLDPFNASQASLATALNLDYAQSTPGLVTSTHVGTSSTAPTGQWIFSGGVFGLLDMSTPSSPYFAIGAFVQ
jgi:hypothetical protein